MNVLGKVELAHEPDFVLGRLTVSPSRRELVRDDGEREVIEHRVMQVLIALTRAQGDIVTRDELIMSCWDGRVVGDDAIHRVLSRLRKVAGGIGAGSIEIETITKIGYRLTSGTGARLGSVPAAPNGGSIREKLHGWRRHKVAGVAAATAVVLAAAFSISTYISRGSAPLVAVGPADSSASSQALARDLFVKLGTRPQLGSGHWQLVEARSARSTPNFLFRTAANAQPTALHSNLMLLDGNDQSLLWSREFSFPPNRESDLRQHMSLTAARVLDCALVARKQGGLPPDLFRLFLNGCAALAETSAEDPQKTAGIMRSVVRQRPDFTPAWARLLMVDINIVQLANNRDGDAKPRDMLRADIERARKIAPDLPEIKLAQLALLPPDNYGDALELLQNVKSRAPEEPQVWLAEADQLARVGRMQDAIRSARRASELDPLSPAVSSSLISTLAWGGEIELARAELGRAERLWPGTGALRDAQFAFHLRYGDPGIALRLTSDGKYLGNSRDPVLLARLDPSSANVDRLIRTIAQHKQDPNPGILGYAIQALAEFDRTDEVFDWLQGRPPEQIADGSYILFRPALAEVRRDRRFMQVAKRIGLIEYWRTSGNWPDFCSEPNFPYDCSQEAARLAS